VKTQFPEAQQSYYRFWLELEFLEGNKVLHVAQSSELIGTNPPELLAITSRAPEGATSLRLALCGQNKFWNPLNNLAAVSDLRLVQLAGEARGALRIEQSVGLTSKDGPRKGTLIVRGDWPDGTALRVTTSRGKTTPTVLMTNGRAEISLNYSPADVGAAVVRASVFDQTANLSVVDPLAATLVISSIQADSLETPALVQLIRDGVMLPGRYQSSVSGIFAAAPWSTDLAPGQWVLRIRRGPEFQAIERVLNVERGQTIRLDKIELVRHVDPREVGWYGGDADGDVYHGERIYTDVSASTAAEIAQAMGLDWVGAGNWGSPKPKTWGEAREAMRELSRPNFLFLWTDEKPKGGKGHACFVGIERPDSDAFGWGWTRAVRALENFETLKIIRDSGAATFANHPLRWWMNADKFRTNMYAALPFDLCACGLLDGYNVNERPQDLQVWSLLLDHGYRVAATAGADFGLDRPAGPVPGKTRMYCYCPDGLSNSSLADSIRRGNTVVSTGPVLMADINGKPPGSTLINGQMYEIRAKAWARADEPDALQRIELWAHGKTIAAKIFDEGSSKGEHTFSWEPRGDWDWIAVRLVTKRGWAITSAFYAHGPDWRPPQQPVRCEVTLSVTGLSLQEQERAIVEIWDNLPGLTTSRKLEERSLSKGPTFDAPVSGTVLVKTADGRRKIMSLYDATGMREHVERIAAGVDRERPLLDWNTYEAVLKRCKTAKIDIAF
jgi:hypothetical protein